MTHLMLRKTVPAIALALGATLTAPSLAAAGDYHSILMSPTRAEGVREERLNSMHFQEELGVEPSQAYEVARVRATHADLLSYDQSLRLWQAPMVVEFRALKKRRSLVQMRVRF